MIHVLKNKDEFIYAYISWEVLNEDGQFDGNGKFAYVADIWIHKDYCRSDTLRILVKLIYDHPYRNGTEYVYWDFSRKTNGKKIIDSTNKEFVKYKKTRIPYKWDKIADRILKKGRSHVK